MTQQTKCFQILVYLGEVKLLVYMTQQTKCFQIIVYLGEVKLLVYIYWSTISARLIGAHQTSCQQAQEAQESCLSCGCWQHPCLIGAHQTSVLPTSTRGTRVLPLLCLLAARLSDTLLIFINIAGKTLAPIACIVLVWKEAVKTDTPLANFWAQCGPSATCALPLRHEIGANYFLYKFYTVL